MIFNVIETAVARWFLQYDLFNTQLQNFFYFRKIYFLYGNIFYGRTILNDCNCSDPEMENQEATLPCYKYKTKMRMKSWIFNNLHRYLKLLDVDSANMKQLEKFGDTLEILDIAGMRIRRLPKNMFSKVPKLKWLDLRQAQTFRLYFNLNDFLQG